MNAAIIPARGGSKGIPLKNLAMLGDRTLLGHTLLQARRCSLLGAIFVSTDNALIANAAGASFFRRPPELAQDDTPTEAVVRHVLERIAFPEVTVILQCTSPFRSSKDIDSAVSMVLNDGYDSVVSVVASHHLIWYKRGDQAFAWNYGPKFRPMRQEMCQYVENGSIYAFRTQGFLAEGCRIFGKVGFYVMGYWSQFQVDTPEDLELCRMIYKKKNGTD